MPNSKQIVYLSQAQYAELIANGSITVDGVTVTYDENDIYVTPQAEPVTDVRVAGTSVTANGVADIPRATNVTPGVACFETNNNSNSYGVGFYSNTNNLIVVVGSDLAKIKSGTNGFRPIVPSHQHESIFYGLAKVAGHDEKDSTEPVGTYTPEAKGAIQSMLGVSDLIATAENTLVASKAYAIGDVFTANGKLYKVTTAIAANDSIVLQNDGETVSGANAVETKVGDGFVKFTDYATLNTAGVVKVNPAYGISLLNGTLSPSRATLAEVVKPGASTTLMLTPYVQHASVFYGLAKVAGADEKNSTLPVGQYTDTAKSAIRSMIGASSTNVVAVQDTQPTDADTKIWLPETAETPVEVPTVAEMNAALAGKVSDVQVNGVSVVSNDVANVPLATNDSGIAGVVKVNVYNGLTVGNGGILGTNPAYDTDIKGGSQGYKPICPSRQHQAVFYGLAKAAGDATQSASSNAVGQYTDNAKASIKAMLGIQDGSTGTVDVSGTTPIITAVENTRYVCGEVTSLNFTPAASGICIVRFTSGSTVTVLTIPSTVKFPEWFDPTSLETNTIYEICITDGIYGAVMSWAQ